MHIKDYLEAIDFAITGGEKFCWQCYGPDARYLDFEIDLNTSISAIFSTKDQRVFRVEVSNVFWRKAFAWDDMEFYPIYLNECQRRHVIPQQAFDDVNYAQVDSESKILDIVRQYKKYAELSQTSIVDPKDIL